MNWLRFALLNSSDLLIILAPNQQLTYCNINNRYSSYNSYCTQFARHPINSHDTQFIRHPIHTAPNSYGTQFIRHPFLIYGTQIIRCLFHTKFRFTKTQFKRVSVNSPVYIFHLFQSLYYWTCVIIWQWPYVYLQSILILKHIDLVPTIYWHSTWWHN